MAERNIRLLVEYEGTAYVGWQLQENGPSVQGALLEALHAITGARPILHAAGRTDAGVHAIGQVVSFLTTTKVPDYRIASALNRLLPDDISVHRSEEAPPEFNARFSSVSKRYRYRVYHAAQRSTLEGRTSWLVRHPLEVEAMQQASLALLGEQDFESFRSAHCEATHGRRRMFSIEVTRRARPPVGELVEIVFHGNAFARHMCRIIAGTLIEVGLGKRTVESVGRALRARDRTHAGITAPPHGLTLLEVEYP